MKDLRLKRGGSAWDRFWKKVNKTPKCWEWTKALDKHGYGLFWYRGGCELAHRVSFTTEYGKIPDGFGVHHDCDNRKCIRPSHLMVSTQQDNMLDALERGRLDVFIGSNHKLSKLKEAQVLEIRASKLSEVKLAEKYGVDRSMIGKIRRNESWNHIKEKK